MWKAPRSSVTATYGLSWTTSHAAMCGCASHTTRITPGFPSRRVMSIIWSLFGSARLNTVVRFRNPCVLWRIGSEFLTRARSPGPTAVTWETKRHCALSSTTSAPPFFPRAMPSIRITLPLTPRSGPTTSISDGFCAPQRSRFLFTGIGSSVGGAPVNLTEPARVPPSFTATTS